MILTYCYWISDLQEENVYEMMNQAYLEAIITLLPCMIGENKWEQLGKASQGDFDIMVTNTDEALLLWAMDCYWNVVAVGDNIKVKDDNRPLMTPKYINEGNSTRKNQGWTEEGKAKYNEYFEMVTKNRKDNYWYGKIWKENFKWHWVAKYRRGRKTSDRQMQPVHGGQIVSKDDL